MTNPRRIACHYLHTWFAVDVLSVVPFELIFYSSTSGMSPSRAAKMMKVGPSFDRLAACAGGTRNGSGTAMRTVSSLPSTAVDVRDAYSTEARKEKRTHLTIRGVFCSRFAVPVAPARTPPYCWAGARFRPFGVSASLGA